jgi:hypothetical protein
MIVIEAKKDENLLLEPTIFEKSMSIHGMIKWEETINSKFNSWMQNET